MQIMSQKKKEQLAGTSDFAAFDAIQTDQVFRLHPVDKPENVVFVFDHTFHSARQTALAYYRDENGHPLGYDGVTGRPLEEREVAVAVGSIFLRKDPPSGALAFEATRATDRDGARRGIGLRKRQRLGAERRRESPYPFGGVQEDGLGILQADEGDAAAAPHPSAEGGKDTAGSARVLNGSVRGHGLGFVHGSSGEGGH